MNDLLWKSANEVTITRSAIKTSTIMLSGVTFRRDGIHGFPVGSGMGIAPGEGRRLPMEVCFDTKRRTWVSAPSFTPSGKQIKGARCVLIEGGKVTAAYTH